MRLAGISKLGVANPFRQRYDNDIGGRVVAPTMRQYFANVTPIAGQPFCESRSAAKDMKQRWTPPTATRMSGISRRPPSARTCSTRSPIVDRMEQNLNTLAAAETIDNGKPVRETLAADVPPAIDRFRYFASCIRTQEGAVSTVDSATYAYHFNERLGVVGQIIPWNFPILIAVWKRATALAAGNRVVRKPAEQAPASIIVPIELIADLPPACRRPAARRRPCLQHIDESFHVAWLTLYRGSIGGSRLSANIAPLCIYGPKGACAAHP